nr:hypothetical protein [Oscillospiraceae bacterium]
VKLFDATVGANGAIAYTGDIPDSMLDFFEKDTAGNISLKHVADGNRTIIGRKRIGYTQAEDQGNQERYAEDFAEFLHRFFSFSKFFLFGL